MFLQKGQPKSLYRPGSSTTVLLFQPGCVEFSPDLLANRNRSDVTSRFSQGLGCPLVETEVVVRSEIALPKAQSLRARQTEQRTAPLALPLR
jgi:phosphatidylserine decarboxylase